MSTVGSRDDCPDEDDDTRVVNDSIGHWDGRRIVFSALHSMASV